MSEQAVYKEDILDSIGDDGRNVVRKYQDFFVGTTKLSTLFRYEIAHIFASPVPGVVGHTLRKWLMTSLLGHAGKEVELGCGVTFRHPEKISIGDRSVVEDSCLLDARGLEDALLKIGADVFIGRDTIISSKTPKGHITIGDHCTIGIGCIISSSGGIQIGDGVTISDSCFIGGSRYRRDRHDIPMYHQQMYTRGPIVIGKDCWIGPGARVLDGANIGDGSVVGAGTTVATEIPENTFVTSGQQLENLPREMKDAAKRNETKG